MVSTYNRSTHHTIYMTEHMPTGEPREPTPESACAQIAELAQTRQINRDQERIAVTAIGDADFALLANRALQQGTDPELLRRTVPESVYTVAATLGLTPEQADNAITRAHRTGPGLLPIDSADEWLWLTLAKHSVDETNTPQEPAQVLAESARRIVAFERYAASMPNVEGDARAYRETIIARTQSIGTAPLGSGVPLYENDLGFYVAYRTGSPVAAVRTPEGLTLYGTNGSTTLADAGITVDKQLSDTFGIVFPKKA